MQVAVEFNDTFKTETGACMARCSVFHGVDVLAESADIEATVLGTLLEHRWVVNTLCTGGDLLTAHEEIVRVGEAAVLGVQHSVERSSANGVAVKHVEVSVVLLLDNATKSLLSLSAQVLELILLEAGISEHLHTFAEVDLDNGVCADEVVEGVLVVDDTELLGVSLLQILEQEDQHGTNVVQDLKVMVLELHLEIQASEFAQMAVGV